MIRKLRQLHPTALFPIVATAVGLPLIFLIPPFQSPDEPAHYFRAWALSEGKLFAEATPTASGSVLPVSLLELQHSTMKSVPGQPFRGLGVDELRHAWNIQTSEERIFLPYTTAAVFPPLVHLPQAVGIGVARPVGRPLLALYAGRLANLAAGILLAWLAVVVAPRGRWIFFTIALLPMAAFLRSSLSPDVMTMGLAWVMTATILRVASPPHRPRTSGLAALAFLLATAKLAYVPLAVAAAAATWVGSRRQSLVTLAAALFGVVASLPWAGAWRPVREEVVTSPTLQLQVLSEQPLYGLVAVISDPLLNAPRYTSEMIGRLGWLDVPLPLSYLAVSAVLILLVASREERAGGWKLRGFLIAAAAVSGFLVSLSQYLAWTPVGATFVEGTSGRYFLPVAPALLVALSSREKSLERTIWIPLLWALLSAGLLLGVVTRFYWL
jgi:uncharacterized membrane protein